MPVVHARRFTPVSYDRDELIEEAEALTNPALARWLAGQRDAVFAEIMNQTGERIWGGAIYLDALAEAIRDAFGAHSRMETISSLWLQIYNHPEFAGGTVFTRTDVAFALADKAPLEWNEQEERAATAAVTEEQLGITLEFSDTYFDATMWYELLRARFEDEARRT
jgi:hypothetical protein